ncbi:MAG TPA: hypothetical protein VHS81_06145, partial [Caulobacteraceae bacterium]|nr:hypothetical protein [Caulobacteraceae bacterium]
MPAIDTFFAALSSPSGAGSLAGSLPARFEVATAGPFPLAKHVPVPDHPVGGELMIEFEDVSFGPLAITGFQPVAGGDENESEFTVTFGPAQVQGHYELFALETPRIELDTGGAVQPFRALEAGPSDEGVTEKQYDQVMQANAQRTKLNQTANGRAMLSAYDQHNDAYNDVFNSNKQLRTYWAGDGAIAEMSDHTSDALDAGAVINPSDKTFGTKGNTYNGNAFAQQLNVWAACIAAKYNDAASAALNFQKPVNTTGNTKTQVTPMTGDQVFGAVNSAAPPAVAGALQTASEEHALHAPLMRIAQNTHEPAHLELLAEHGAALEPDEVEAIQAIFAEGRRVDDPAARLEIAAGNCAAALTATSFRFRLTRQPDGAITAKLTHATL